MTAAYVERILEKKFSDWAAAQSPAIAVAWQNVTFTPPANTRWASAFILPADQGEGSLAGDLRTYEGVFQANLHLPVGAGLGEARTLGDSLDAAFTTTAPLSLVIGLETVMRLFITRPMRRGPAQNVPGYAVVPFSCSYRADRF